MGLQVPGFFTEYSKASCYYLFLMVAYCSSDRYLSDYPLRHGLTFRAVLNDELAASSSGINTIRVRILAFTISSAMAGLAGGLYGHYLMLITGHSFFRTDVPRSGHGGDRRDGQFHRPYRWILPWPWRFFLRYPNLWRVSCPPLRAGGFGCGPVCSGRVNGHHR